MRGWQHEEVDPATVAVAVGLVILLIVGMTIFEAAYPCRRYETQATTETTCYTTTLGGMTSCTTRPSEERVCVEREGW